MKRKLKRIALIVLPLLLLLTILRETGVVNLNWYDSSIRGDVTATWTDMHTTTEIPRHLLADSLITGPCNYSGMGAVPVYVWIEDELVGDTVMECQQIGVNGSEVHDPFLYTPLYKAGDFNASIPVASAVILYVPHDSMVTVHNINFSGTVNVNADISVSGFVSAYTVRRIIRRYVAENVYKQVVAHTAAMK